MSKDEGQQHDLMALAYDDYAENHHPLYRHRLQHARNHGAHHVPGTRHTVDGYDADTNTVYEFYGCYWHGCRTCHPQRTETHACLLDRSMDDVHTLVDRKRDLLLARRYRLAEILECQWTHLKPNDPDVASFVAELDLQAPLSPREAFYGGRTNAIRLYHQAVDDKEIHYDDYTSLYPWVNKYGKYPTGPLTIL